MIALTQQDPQELTTDQVQQEPTESIVENDTIDLDISTDITETSDTITEDTISHEGINPILLQEEARRREIQEYREQIERPEVQVAPVVRRRVDTTCWFCPEGDPTLLHELTSIENQNPFPDNYLYLYDKQDLNSLSHLNKPVFDNYKEKTEALQAPKHIIIKEIGSDAFSIDWILVPILASLALLSFINYLYIKYIKTFFSSVFYSFSADRLHRERSVPLQRFTFLTDILFYIVMPVFIYKIADYYSFLQNYQIPYYIVIFLIFSILFIFRAYSYLYNSIVSYLTGENAGIQELSFNKLIYPRVIAIVSPPLLLLFVYGSESLSIASLYIFFIVVIIVLLIRTIRIVSVFIRKGYSLFYLILYLCTLEIIPFLVVIKEVFWS